MPEKVPENVQKAVETLLEPADNSEELERRLKVALQAVQEVYDDLPPPEFPMPPETDNPLIEERKWEIFNKLLSGWSPGRIASILDGKYGVTPTPEEILAYRDSIPPEIPLRTRALHAKLHYVDVEIDPLTEMQKLLRMMADRLDDALVLEDTLVNKLPDISGRPAMLVSELDDLVYGRAKVYMSALEKYVKLIADLGAVAPQEVLPPEGSMPVQTVGELLNQRKKVFDQVAEGEYKQLADGQATGSDN